jgi:hypothetical protein
MAAPKVFLSHASEDKERFVIPFATALRAKGIDVWVDRWEMLPGDSLIQKIFEEGIKEASAVIVVLSAISVRKPWVREEIDTAAVNRINNGSKLIPIVLDDCMIPQVLQTTLWENVKDHHNIAPVVERVTASIFNSRPKPPLGLPPVYTTAAYPSVSGLSPTDTFVLMEAGNAAIEKDVYVIDPSLYLNEGKLSPDVFSESVDILDQRGYIRAFHHLGGGPFSFQLTVSGLEICVTNCISDYRSTVQKVTSLLINENYSESTTVAARLGARHRLIKHIFDIFEARGDVKQVKGLDGKAHVVVTSAALRRTLR